MLTPELCPEYWPQPHTALIRFIASVLPTFVMDPLNVIPSSGNGGERSVSRLREPTLISDCIETVEQTATLAFKIS